MTLPAIIVVALLPSMYPAWSAASSVTLLVSALAVGTSSTTVTLSLFVLSVVIDESMSDIL